MPTSPLALHCLLPPSEDASSSEPSKQLRRPLQTQSPWMHAVPWAHANWSGLQLCINSTGRGDGDGGGELGSGGGKRGGGKGSVGRSEGKSASIYAGKSAEARAQAGSQKERRRSAEPVGQQEDVRRRLTEGRFPLNLF